ncbi:LPXTG-motif cell wall anchor domain-containing protein [Halobacillus dabanensis]|uniref:LPXTG-motif cell wall anchor domain-containing protein n=1 Tax=Halobacillus dabanensis TaxID=240302 RepID=A0A1I3RMX1_HALDA|nr:TasA family protein [Halobacillus dabanensis]SFJ47202.1 LPXTG-motif cell wall anchor domain-containing protein [Halobacillus dabanensis]
MKKLPLFLKFFSIYSICILLFVLFQPIGSTKALEDASEIDLSTSHERVIDIENFKPGDYAVRSFALNNDGTQNLQYTMTSSHKSGSEKLYNQLTFILEIEGEQVFAGHLSDFEKISARKLAAKNADEMTLKVEFPYESGNEFQGLATEVGFTFFAEGDIPPVSTPDQGEGSPQSQADQPTGSSEGGMLPQTGEGSPLLYYLVGGLLLTLGVSLYIRSFFRKKQPVVGAESS